MRRGRHRARAGVELLRHEQAADRERCPDDDDDDDNKDDNNDDDDDDDEQPLNCSKQAVDRKSVAPSSSLFSSSTSSSRSSLPSGCRMLYLQGEAGEGGKDSANFSSSLHQALHTQTHLTSIIAVTVRMERISILCYTTKKWASLIVKKRHGREQKRRKRTNE